MKLKPTQIKVLSVLVENKDKSIGMRDIHKQSKVNSNHIESAIIFFMDNDLVYQPNIDGEVQVTADGIDAYYENI
jgi:hypothetical protein